MVSMKNALVQCTTDRTRWQCADGWIGRRDATEPLGEGVGEWRDGFSVLGQTKRERQRESLVVCWPFRSPGLRPAASARVAARCGGAGVRRRMNIELNFSPNFEGL